MDFIQALTVAEAVFDEYKESDYRWWRKMDGTPILNDIAVRMARAYIDKFNECMLESLTEVGESNSELLNSTAYYMLSNHWNRSASE